MAIYLNVLRRHYADFRTRTRRREFWLYSLCNAAVYLVFTAGLALERGVSDVPSDRQLIAIGSTVLGLLLYTGLTFVPTLAITVRRMHDIGRSGWSLWRLIVPNSWLWLLLNTTFDSQPGANRWGPNPKGLGAGVQAI